MKPGERQVAETIDGIRADHTKRYRFAADRLKGLSVIDIGAGVGYGSKLLADAGCKVHAVEIDAEAVEYADQHYSHSDIDYHCEDALLWVPNPHDAAVCFEMLEHVTEPETILRQIPANRLIASVPNEDVFPYSDNILYHYRHYTPEQFEALLNRCGWQVLEWHGQAGRESDVEPNVPGRTLVAVCERADHPEGGTCAVLPKIRAVPNSVAIVAMGMSSQTYLRLCSNAGDRRRVANETWAINSMGGVIEHDLLFHMDDCRVQEARASRNPDGNVAGMLNWLKNHPQFLTSKAYPEYPGAVEFPLEDVMNSLNVSYFNSTVAYAVAYAMYIGVKKISMYGADYSYADGHKAEKGRGCVEYLLGIASAHGVKIEIASDSTLMDANVPKHEKFYGYDAVDLDIEQTESGVKVKQTPRASLPSAEEIEVRYRHEVAA